MKVKRNQPFSHYMRSWHRNIGFFTLGFVLIYAISGIVLIFRDTDFLKTEKVVKINLPASLTPADLGSALRIRDLKITETRGDISYFQGGFYDMATGNAEYTVKELVFPLNKITVLHKSPSKNPVHWITLAFGVILVFMAISSFWMFNKGTDLFRKGLFISLSGLLVAFLLLAFIK